MEKVNAAIGIVKKENKFLVLHRSPTRKSMANKWQFVSGHTEEGEDARKTVIREIKEETTLEIEVVKIGNNYDYYEKDLEILWHITPVLCKWVSGNVTIDAEHSEFKWLTAKEICELDFVPMAFEQLDQFGYYPKL